jgi:hypothetical protein
LEKTTRIYFSQIVKDGGIPNAYLGELTKSGFSKEELELRYKISSRSNPVIDSFIYVYIPISTVFVPKKNK